MVSEGWCACLKVETVEGTLVFVADDSSCHHLLSLPHCGYDRPVLVFLPNSASDPMTSWILSNRQWYLVRPKNRSPISLHVILDPLEPYDVCTIGNGMSHYMTGNLPYRASRAPLLACQGLKRSKTVRFNCG